MGQLSKLSPDVFDYIKPIIDGMSRIAIAQKMCEDELNPTNENALVKEIKKSCVHIIWTGKDFEIAAKPNKDGKLVCEACGREICQKFDNASNVDVIMGVIPVINQIMFFGMLHGMKRAPLETLVNIKKTLPAVAQLAAQLNKYVSKTDKAADTLSNIGSEYQTPSMFKSITGM